MASASLAALAALGVAGVVGFSLSQLRVRQVRRQDHLERVLPRDLYIERVANDLKARHIIRLNNLQEKNATIQVQCGLFSNRVRLVSSFPWLDSQFGGGNIDDPTNVHHQMDLAPHMVDRLTSIANKLPPPLVAPQQKQPQQQQQQNAVPVAEQEPGVQACVISPKFPPATCQEQQLLWRSQMPAATVQDIDSEVQQDVLSSDAFSVRTWTDSSNHVSQWRFL